MNDDHKRKYFEYLRKNYKKEKKEDVYDLSPKENLLKNDKFKTTNNFTEVDNNDFALLEKEIKSKNRQNQNKSQKFNVWKYPISKKVITLTDIDISNLKNL